MAVFLKDKCLIQKTISINGTGKCRQAETISFAGYHYCISYSTWLAVAFLYTRFPGCYYPVYPHEEVLFPAYRYQKLEENTHCPALYSYCLNNYCPSHSSIAGVAYS